MQWLAPSCLHHMLYLCHISVGLNFHHATYASVQAYTHRNNTLFNYTKHCWDCLHVSSLLWVDRLTLQDNSSLFVINASVICKWFCNIRNHMFWGSRFSFLLYKKYVCQFIVQNVLKCLFFQLCCKNMFLIICSSYFMWLNWLVDFHSQNRAKAI